MKKLICLALLLAGCSSPSLMPSEKNQDPPLVLVTSDAGSDASTCPLTFDTCANRCLGMLTFACPDNAADACISDCMQCKNLTCEQAFNNCEYVGCSSADE